MSEKVLSVRMVGKRNKYGSKNNQLDFLKFNPFSLLLLLFSLLAEIYLIVKYYGREVTAYYSILLFVLGTTALIGVIWLNKGNFITYELPFMKSGWEGGKYIFGIFSLMAVIGIMMVVLQATFRFALELIDTYFYYLCAAVIEEAFFRMFLLSTFIAKIKNKIIGIVSGIFISSLFFSIAHWSAYGYSVSLMLSMFFGGFIFSIYFLAFKDITITMLGHLLINFITVSIQIGSGLILVG